MAVEKLDILLKCLLPYLLTCYYIPKTYGQLDQAIDKTNELSCLYVDMASILDMEYMLQIGESTIHISFMTWVVFMEFFRGYLDILMSVSIVYIVRPTFRRTIGTLVKTGVS